MRDAKGPYDNTTDLMQSIKEWCYAAQLPLISLETSDVQADNGAMIWCHGTIRAHFNREISATEGQLLSLLVLEREKAIKDQQLRREWIHEMGNALSILDGQLQFLSNDFSKERFAALERALNHMTYLLRAAGNFGSADIDDCEMRTILEEVVQDIQPFISEKDLDVRICCESDHIVWYPGYLRQILINLLKNAIEAAPVGSVIHLTYIKHASYVEVVVQNPDLVISADTMAQLFMPYFSSSGSANRGLGLSLSRNLAEYGEARLDYDPERGFVLGIPRRTG